MIRDFFAAILYLFAQLFGHICIWFGNAAAAVRSRKLRNEELADSVEEDMEEDMDGLTPII